MIVYLAGPIDNALDNKHVKETRETLHFELRDHVVYDPAHAWSVPSIQSPRPILQEINDYALDACDIVVAFLIPNVLTIGTILEIELANTLNKTVILFAPDMKPSWSLAGHRRVIHCTDQDMLRDTIESMAAVLG
jgi:nucleoside 2-deoxyribosyltransferase